MAEPALRCNSLVPALVVGLGATGGRCVAAICREILSDRGAVPELFRALVLTIETPPDPAALFPGAADHPFTAFQLSFPDPASILSRPEIHGELCRWLPPELEATPAPGATYCRAHGRLGFCWNVDTVASLLTNAARDVASPRTRNHYKELGIPVSTTPRLLVFAAADAPETGALVDLIALVAPELPGLEIVIHLVVKASDETSPASGSAKAATLATCAEVEWLFGRERFRLTVGGRKGTVTADAPLFPRAVLFETDSNAVPDADADLSGLARAVVAGLTTPLSEKHAEALAPVARKFGGRILGQPTIWSTVGESSARFPRDRLTDALSLILLRRTLELLTTRTGTTAEEDVTRSILKEGMFDAAGLDPLLESLRTVEGRVLRYRVDTDAYVAQPAENLVLSIAELFGPEVQSELGRVAGAVTERGRRIATEAGDRLERRFLGLMDDPGVGPPSAAAIAERVATALAERAAEIRRPLEASLVPRRRDTQAAHLRDEFLAFSLKPLEFLEFQPGPFTIAKDLVLSTLRLGLPPEPRYVMSLRAETLLLERAAELNLDLDIRTYSECARLLTDLSARARALVAGPLARTLGWVRASLATVEAERRRVLEEAKAETARTSEILLLNDEASVDGLFDALAPSPREFLKSVVSVLGPPSRWIEQPDEVWFREALALARTRFERVHGSTLSRILPTKGALRDLMKRLFEEATPGARLNLAALPVEEGPERVDLVLAPEPDREAVVEPLRGLRAPIAVPGNDDATIGVVSWLHALPLAAFERLSTDYRAAYLSAATGPSRRRHHPHPAEELTLGVSD